MTERDRLDFVRLRIGWIKALASAYEAEHDWAEDEDPSATREMLAECRSVADEMLGQIDDHESRIRVPIVSVAADDPDIPF